VPNAFVFCVSLVPRIAQIAVRGRRPGPLDDIANEINNLLEGHETPTLACVSFVLLSGLREKGFNLLGCFRQVRLVHDVVAVEN
jgi:hypothetical protein